MNHTSQLKISPFFWYFQRATAAFKNRPRPPSSATIATTTLRLRKKCIWRIVRHNPGFSKIIIFGLHFDLIIDIKNRSNNNSVLWKTPWVASSYTSSALTHVIWCGSMWWNLLTRRRSDRHRQTESWRHPHRLYPNDDYLALPWFPL